MELTDYTKQASDMINKYGKVVDTSRKFLKLVTAMDKAKWDMDDAICKLEGKPTWRDRNPHLNEG